LLDIFNRRLLLHRHLFLLGFDRKFLHDEL